MAAVGCGGELVDFSDRLLRSGVRIAKTMPGEKKKKPATVSRAGLSLYG